MKPMISVAAATGLLDAVAGACGDPDQVLSAVHLDRSVFAQSDGFMPAAIFAELLREAARATKDDCFGLHFGERFDPKYIGPLVYVALNSPTIGAGVQNVERYLHVYDSSAKWSFSIEGDRGLIRFVLNLDVGDLRHSNEHGMAIILNTLRMMIGSQWAPLEVQLAHAAPEQITEHHRIFRYIADAEDREQLEKDLLPMGITHSLLNKALRLHGQIKIQFLIPSLLYQESLIRVL